MALERDPNDADTLELFSLTLSWSGKPARAIELLCEARRLNPHEPYYFPQGTADLNAGRTDEAITAFRNSIEHHPNFRPAYLCLAAAYGLSGNEKQAKVTAAKIRKISPDFDISTDLRTPLKNNDLKRFIQGLRMAGLTQE